MLTELIRYRAEHEKDHPLHGYQFPFAVVGPETFELAVEHAGQESRPLYEILLEFWEDSGRFEMTDPSPEAFRGRPLRERRTFAVAFLKPLLIEAGLTFEDET